MRDFSESDLLRRLKQDAERAFDALFRHYRALVYQFAFSYLQSRPAAEKIVQECFISRPMRNGAAAATHPGGGDSAQVTHL